MHSCYSEYVLYQTVAFRLSTNPRCLVFTYIMFWLQCMNWQNSKRLLFGALVCLSRDNFETFLFATVSDRNPEDLQNGQVLLSFSRDSHPVLAELQMSDSFLMVETTTYFETYRHILEGLQEQEVDDLPFQRYVSCRNVFVCSNYGYGAV